MHGHTSFRYADGTFLPWSQQPTNHKNRGYLRHGSGKQTNASAYLTPRLYPTTAGFSAWVRPVRRLALIYYIQVSADWLSRGRRVWWTLDSAELVCVSVSWIFCGAFCGSFAILLYRVEEIAGKQLGTKNPPISSIARHPEHKSYLANTQSGTDGSERIQGGRREGDPSL